MIFENTGFYFREALLSFRRSTLMTTAAILSITTILIIVGIFLLISINSSLFLKNLISINSSLFLKNLEDQLEIVVYLEDNISKAELNNLKNNFTSIDEIKEINFVSKEEAYQRLLKSLGEQKDILSAIEKNPLPASFEIQAKDPKMIEQIANQITKFKKVEEVEYGRETAEKLLNFTYIFRRAVMIVLALLVFASILIVSSIIKITVYARRNEIEIMSLAGATSWFIKWPFIIEGFLQGFISSLFSTIILYNFYFFAVDKVNQAIPFLPLVVDNMDLLRIGIVIVLLGSFVGILGSMFSVGGILGSMFSVGKYLDV
jgi:cell division transport system permease protein